MASPLLVAKNADKELALLPSLANRHGLVTNNGLVALLVVE
jgi:hypothetical protein